MIHCCLMFVQWFLWLKAAEAKAKAKAKAEAAPKAKSKASKEARGDGRCGLARTDEIGQ